MESKKILVISNMYPSKEWPHYGVFVKNCVELLNEAGYHTYVIYVEKTDRKIKKIWAYISFYMKAIFSGVMRDYDAIYGHYASHIALPILIIKKIKRNIPIILNVHGNDIVPETEKDEKFNYLVKKVLAVSTKIISPSIYFKDILIKTYNVLEDKIVLYPSGGVDTKKIHHFNKEDALKHFNLDGSYKYIGYVSRIEENKGWDCFIRASKRIIDVYPEYKLIVVGDGEQNKEFEELVLELQMGDNLIKYSLLAQDELPFIYSMLDIFVFPTHRKSESLGLVGLEAMACEAVVVASDKYGPSSYMEDGVNGVTFSSKDEISLFQSMQKIIKMDLMDKNMLRMNARKTAEKYSSENTKHILIELFDAILSN